MTLEEFKNKVARNIAAHSLLMDHKPVIVGVSGGADSVALLCVLNDLGYTCLAAHCNYHLRGEESNRDMRAVQSLCSALGIDLYVRDMDVQARCSATGESTEMACRELRYAWWADLLDRQRAQAIAVAHHSEDNIETFMLNLMRGSGIAGLSAMQWRNGYVIRPLLDFSRQDIEEYLNGKNIHFVVDSTNAESIFARNKLRNELLPAIEKSFPGAMQGILASISHLVANKAVYDETVKKISTEYFDGHQLRLADLMSQQEQHRILLFEMLRPFGFNITQIDNILSNSRKSGLQFHATSRSGFGHNSIERHTTIILDRGMLNLSDSQDSHRGSTEAVEVNLHRDILTPVHILVSEHSIVEFKPERNADVAYFDVEVLEDNPKFELRKWRKGDRMLPFGMTHDKLLSDLFTNAKYSLDDKRKAWVLTRNGHILWAVGLRQSSMYSISPETRRYLRLELRH